MQPQITFRDDDIGFAHTAHAGELQMRCDFITDKFIEIDKLFIKYGVTHTIAVIANDIEKATRLVEYIKANKHIDVQLHCWDHLHYPENMKFFKTQLIHGIEKLNHVFGKRPTIFYPPYNDVNSDMDRICQGKKIQMSYKKMSLSGYLKGQKENVINFHYWADECKDLEQALIKYTNENSRN